MRKIFITAAFLSTFAVGLVAGAWGLSMFQGAVIVEKYLIRGESEDRMQDGLIINTTLKAGELRENFNKLVLLREVGQEIQQRTSWYDGTVTFWEYNPNCSGTKYQYSISPKIGEHRLPSAQDVVRWVVQPKWGQPNLCVQHG